MNKKNGHKINRDQARKQKGKRRTRPPEQAPMNNNVEWIGQKEYQVLTGKGKTFYEAMMTKEPDLFRNGKTHDALLAAFWRRNPNFRRSDVY